METINQSAWAEEPTKILSFVPTPVLLNSFLFITSIHLSEEISQQPSWWAVCFETQQGRRDGRFLCLLQAVKEYSRVSIWGPTLRGQWQNPQHCTRREGTWTRKILYFTQVLCAAHQFWQDRHPWSPITQALMGTEEVGEGDN